MRDMETSDAGSVPIRGQTKTIPDALDNVVDEENSTNLNFRRGSANLGKEENREGKKKDFWHRITTDVLFMCSSR